MNSRDHGSVAAEPPPYGPQTTPPGEPNRRPSTYPDWVWWQGILAFIATFMVLLVVVSLVQALTVPVGTDPDRLPPAVNYVLFVSQAVLFVGAAVVFAAIRARPRPAHFGLRRTPLWRTLGWALLGLAVYFLFAITYGLTVDPDAKQSIPEALGVNRSTALLVAGGFVVIVLAPIAEEFFFRGFFYRTLRNSLSRTIGRTGGVLFGAILTAALFGVLHFEERAIPLLPQLVVLGFVFCLVYERTGSLFSVIGLHAVINTLGFLAVAKNSWIVALAFGTLMVVACMTLPRLMAREPTPQAA